MESDAMRPSHIQLKSRKEMEGKTIARVVSGNWRSPDAIVGLVFTDGSLVRLDGGSFAAEIERDVLHEGSDFVEYGLMSADEAASYDAAVKKEREAAEAEDLKRHRRASYEKLKAMAERGEI